MRISDWSSDVCSSDLFGFANAAVDALVGVDDEHILALIETVDGAHLDAVHIFAPDAGNGDDIGHGLSAPSGGGNRVAMHATRSPLCRVKAVRTRSATDAHHSN